MILENVRESKWCEYPSLLKILAETVLRLILAASKLLALELKFHTGKRAESRLLYQSRRDALERAIARRLERAKTAGSRHPTLDNRSECFPLFLQ